MIKKLHLQEEKVEKEGQKTDMGLSKCVPGGKHSHSEMKAKPTHNGGWKTPVQKHCRRRSLVATESRGPFKAKVKLPLEVIEVTCVGWFW